MKEDEIKERLKEGYLNENCLQEGTRESSDVGSNDL